MKWKIAVFVVLALCAGVLLLLLKASREADRIGKRMSLTFLDAQKDVTTRWLFEGDHSITWRMFLASQARGALKNGAPEDLAAYLQAVVPFVPLNGGQQLRFVEVESLEQPVLPEEIGVYAQDDKLYVGLAGFPGQPAEEQWSVAPLQPSRIERPGVSPDALGPPKPMLEADGSPLTAEELTVARLDCLRNSLGLLLERYAKVNGKLPESAHELLAAIDGHLQFPWTMAMPSNAHGTSLLVTMDPEQRLVYSRLSQSGDWEEEFVRYHFGTDGFERSERLTSDQIREITLKPYVFNPWLLVEFQPAD